MEFCPKCGTLLSQSEREGRDVLVCSSCGHIKTESESVSEKAEKKEEVVVMKGEGINLPKTDITQCDNEKCDSKEAYFDIEQTRSADEPPTRIYTCVKCKHKWREYS